MKDPMWELVPSLLSLLSLAFVLGFVFGGCLGFDANKAQAVRHNEAHYVLDENNERQFRWGAKP